MGEEFETWEEVINTFLLDRLNKKHEKLLSEKDKKKSLEKQGILIQIQKKLDKQFKDNEDYNAIINRKNSGEDKQIALEFQKMKFLDLKSFAKNNDINISDLIERYTNSFEKIKKSHYPENWITEKAPNANKVRFSTNVAKLTHPSIKGATSFFVEYSTKNVTYLNSDTLKKPNLDDSVDNAADTPIMSFLKLSIKNKQIADYIKSEDPSPFTWITNDSNKLTLWIEQFAKSFTSQDISSHVLSKQVYFPINKEKNIYHILSNVKSSSLAHAIYHKITKYSNINDKYTKEMVVKYPLRAKIAITASSKAHMNVSPLNVKRDGFLHLLCTKSPIWQGKIKPPIYQESLFNAMANTCDIKENIDYLREFLLRLENIDLSVKDPKKMKHLKRWIENIIDEVLFYFATIQNIESDWSNTDNILLKKEHQALLNPYRNEDNFQAYFHSNVWQDEVCIDFAEWLNAKLKGKDKKFTPQKEHTKLWKGLMKNELREFMVDLSFDVKRKLEEKR